MTLHEKVFANYTRTFTSVLYLAIIAAKKIYQHPEELPVYLTHQQSAAAIALWQSLREFIQSEDGSVFELRNLDEMDDQGEAEADEADDDDDVDGEQEYDGSVGPVATDPPSPDLPRLPSSILSQVESLATTLFLKDNGNEVQAHPAAVVLMSLSKARTGSFRPPRLMVGYIGHVLYGIQITVLYREIHSRSNPFENSINDAGITTASEVHSEHPAIAWVSHAATQTTRFTKADCTLSRVVATDDSATLLSYSGKFWPLKAFREYSVSTVAQCWSLLDSLLEGLAWREVVGKVITGSHGKGLYDDLAQTEPGYSVFSDQANELESAWEGTLEELATSRQLGTPTVDLKTGKKRISWNRARLESFLDHGDELLERLQVAFYEACVAPPMGTRFVSLRFKNSVEGKRDLFIINNMMTFIVQSEEAKSTPPMALSLPWSLHVLICLYLAIIRPIVNFLASRHLPLSNLQLSNLETYLWCRHNGKLVSSDDLSENMKSAIAPFIGEAASVYGVRANRTLKMFWGDHITKQHPLAQEPHNYALDTFEEQSGHSIGIGRLFYGRVGGSNAIPSLLPQSIRDQQLLGQLLHRFYGYEQPPDGMF